MSNQKDNTFVYKKKSGFAAPNFNQDVVFAFAEDYKAFMNAGKTERECVAITETMVRKAGYVPFVYGTRYNRGDKVYYQNRGKAMVLVHMGQKPLEEGLRVSAAHIDAPRIDLKSQPIYDDGGMVLCKTHYYGGIKKYQWLTIPLALHGTVIRGDSTRVDICVGEEKLDPVFSITDLPPHLAKEQSAKTLGDGIPGESLTPVIGSEPMDARDEDGKLKEKLLSLLHEKYGVCEEDLLSAELMFVPAYKARDVGFDRSMIGAYGQDDRVCAYPSLRALLDMQTIPPHSSCVILADKEEIGSVGNTGLESNFFFDMMDDMAEARGENKRKMYAASKCLSADVSVCYDPNYSSVFDKYNIAQINQGAVICKYVGARGKTGTSDASAEYMGWIRNLFNQAGVVWQTSEIGKVDQGGGGTVAKFLASKNMDIVDFGVPVLSMHAPYELTSKVDLYNTYLGVAALFQS